MSLFGLPGSISRGISPHPFYQQHMPSSPTPFTGVVDLTKQTWQIMSSFRFNLDIGDYGAVGGIALTPDGTLVVTDEHITRSTMLLSHDGRCLSSFTYCEGWNPKGVSVGSDGTIYVADAHRSSIQVFDSKKVLIADMNLGSFFFTPQQLSLARDGTLFVLGNETLLRFSAQRKYLGTWSEDQYCPLDERYEPDSPKPITYIAYDPLSGNIGVHNQGNRFLRICTADGTSVRKIDLYGEPVCFAFDGAGNLVVCLKDCVQLVHSDGKLLRTFGHGSFTDIAHVLVDQQGRILVADSQYHISVWQ